MSEATATKYVGQPLRRREDFKFVTGKGRYTDDIKSPGMLHMAVLRSPHAHAVIRQVDLSAAQASPGVRLALSGADLAGKIGAIVPNWIIPGTKVPDRPVVAIDRVRFRRRMRRTGGRRNPGHGARCRRIDRRRL
jgi:carbon-monoxide dehydrogenase large subunit